MYVHWGAEYTLGLNAVNKKCVIASAVKQSPGDRDYIAFNCMIASSRCRDASSSVTCLN
jgi:hypothetical protein